RKSETVLLHWQTANEINTDFFRVQRSLDGINFKDIGTVPAMHGSINNKYSYQDNVAGTGSEKFFYRLKQTDINSAFTFSKIIAVNKMDNNTSLIVYPNPFSEYLIIKSEHPHELAGAVLTLIDLSGRKMKKQTLSPLETQKVNLTGLSKGVYMVQISKR